MKKIKGELAIKAFTDGRNTKVVVTGPKDIRARQLGNVSLTGTARCHEEDYENSWIKRISKNFQMRFARKKALSGRFIKTWE